VAHHALGVGYGRLDVLERLLAGGHPQRREDRADALLRLALVDFEIGDDLLKQFHEPKDKQSASSRQLLE
jgi:hypothetical protein